MNPLRLALLALLLCAAQQVGAAEDATSDEGATDEAESQAETADPAGPQFKSMSGMSVLGNNEAPKSLVIVPWKSSQIGDGIGVLNSLDNRPMPVDREVFSRELDYYHIRTEPQPDRAAPVRVGSR